MIEKLQAICETSLETTAIRYAQTVHDLMAVVRSSGSTIGYAVMSDPLMDFSGLDWIRKGKPLPSASVTAGFNAEVENITRCRRTEGRSCLRDWFNGKNQQGIAEEVVGLGSYE